MRENELTIAAPNDTEPLRDNSDEALLLDFRNSANEVSFAMLYKRYELEVYNYLRRFLGHVQSAQDVLQNTFVQVYTKAHLFDDAKKFRPWVYTIATNCAIDYQRRNNRHHRHVSIDRVPVLGPDDNGDSPFSNILQARELDPLNMELLVEQRKWVREQVKHLPANQQTAVKLVYFEGLKYREAAEKLGIPIGTVKSRLHTAVDILTNEFQKAS